MLPEKTKTDSFLKKFQNIDPLEGFGGGKMNKLREEEMSIIKKTRSKPTTKQNSFGVEIRKKKKPG